MVEVSPFLQRMQWQALQCTASKLGAGGQVDLRPAGSGSSSARRPPMGVSGVNNAEVGTSAMCMWVLVWVLVWVGVGGGGQAGAMAASDRQGPSSTGRLCFSFYPK